MSKYVTVKNKHNETVTITEKAYLLSKKSYQLVDGDVSQPAKIEPQKKNEGDVQDVGKEIDYKTLSDSDLVEVIKTGNANFNKITNLRLKDVAKIMGATDDELKGLRSKKALVDFINSNIG